MPVFILVMGLLILYLASTNKLSAMIAIIFTDIGKKK